MGLHGEGEGKSGNCGQVSVDTASIKKKNSKNKFFSARDKWICCIPECPLKPGQSFQTFPLPLCEAPPIRKVCVRLYTTCQSRICLDCRLCCLCLLLSHCLSLSLVHSLRFLCVLLESTKVTASSSCFTRAVVDCVGVHEHMVCYIIVRQ